MADALPVPAPTAPEDEEAELQHLNAQLTREGVVNTSRVILAGALNLVDRAEARDEAGNYRAHPSHILADAVMLAQALRINQGNAAGAFKRKGSASGGGTKRVEFLRIDARKPAPQIEGAPLAPLSPPAPDVIVPPVASATDPDAAIVPAEVLPPSPSGSLKDAILASIARAREARKHRP